MEHLMDMLKEMLMVWLMGSCLAQQMEQNLELWMGNNLGMTMALSTVESLDSSSG
jgi:hypothetical protein